MTGSNTLNGRNVVTFDGSDILTISDSDTLDGSAGLSIFVTHTPTVVDGDVRGLLSKRLTHGHQESYSLFYWNNNDFYMDIQGSNDRFASNNSFTAGTNYIVNVDYDGSLDAANRVSLYSQGALDITESETSASLSNTASNLHIGALGGRGASFFGDIGEIIIHTRSLSSNEAAILNQYQSAKWDTALTPPGTGADELAKATAADGYSAFTVGYLERLSGSADIVLAATNDINLDLQGDTLALDSGRSISLTTTSGNISTESAGVIQTSGVGAITFNSGQDILLNHNVDLSATGAGNISLIATRDIDIDSSADVSANTGTIALTAGRDVLLDSDIVTSSATADAIQLSAGDNFTNNAGSDALQAANSNWVVYSDSPVGNQNNGLLPDESVYGQANIGATIASKTAGGNNVFGYNTAVRPTVTYDVDNNSVEYGDAITGNSLTYNTGLVGDDAIGAIGTSGSATFGGYAPGDNAGTYSDALSAATGTLDNVLGYDYAFNAGYYTVTPAELTATVNPASTSRLKGADNPEFSIEYSGFKLGETESVLDTLPTLPVLPSRSSPNGRYIITAGGGADANYTFSYESGTLNIESASVVPTAVEQQIAQPQGVNQLNPRKVIKPLATSGNSLPNSRIDITIADQVDSQKTLPQPEIYDPGIVRLSVDPEFADIINWTSPL